MVFLNSNIQANYFITGLWFCQNRILNPRFLATVRPFLDEFFICPIMVGICTIFLGSMKWIKRQYLVPCSININWCMQKRFPVYYCPSVSEFLSRGFPRSKPWNLPKMAASNQKDVCCPVDFNAVVLKTFFVHHAMNNMFTHSPGY